MNSPKLKAELKAALNALYDKVPIFEPNQIEITGKEYIDRLNSLTQEAFILEHMINVAKSFPKGFLIETILLPYLKDAEKRLKAWEQTKFIVQ